MMRNLSIAVIAAGSMLAFTVFASTADVGAPGNKASSPPVVAPAFSWTGCHLGIEGGGAAGRSNHVAESTANTGLPITGGLNPSGGLVGGTAGCDYQVNGLILNGLVFGIEDDLSWTSEKGSASDIPPFATVATSQTSVQWLDTLRGRAGVAQDRLFVYGTGGVAWAGTSVNVSNPAVPASVTDSRTRTGWVLGLGTEWAGWTWPAGSLTFKLEYLYADFGTRTYINPQVTTGAFTVATRGVQLSDNIFRAGINWKFW